MHSGVNLGPLELCCSGGSQAAAKQRAEWLTWGTERTWLGSQGARRRGVRDAWKGLDSDDALM